MDVTVVPSVVQSLEQMYRDFGISNITTMYSILGSHTFPTTNYGNLCLQSFSPYISMCAYDGAGNALQAIFGQLYPPATPIMGNIITLSQAKFTGDDSPSSLSLDNDAYVYVPTSCKNRSTWCKLLIALHGYLQYYGTVGNAFIENAGFNGWAEANNIIVAYPQTINSLFEPINPAGCWDWWGYLDSSYATKAGKQMHFLRNLQDFIVRTF